MESYHGSPECGGGGGVSLQGVQRQEAAYNRRAELLQLMPWQWLVSMCLDHLFKRHGRWKSKSLSTTSRTHWRIYFLSVELDRK